MWPTPTPFPAPVMTPPFTLDVITDGDLLVDIAETSVNGWNTVNQDGLIDNAMTLLLVLLVLLALGYLIHRIQEL